MNKQMTPIIILTALEGIFNQEGLLDRHNN